MTRTIPTLVFAAVVGVLFFGLTFSKNEMGIAPAQADAVCGPYAYSCGTSPSNAICCNDSQSCCTYSGGGLYCGNPGCNGG